MRNYYLMRSSAELIKENRIGYGWKSVNFSQYSSAEGILEKVNAGRRKNQIKRFFNLKEGDVVLVPTHRSVTIGVVSEGKFYDENAPKNAWNQVAVNFTKEDGTLRKISTRDNLITNHLLSRLRLRMTIANLKEFSSEIEGLIKTSEYGTCNISSIYDENEESKASELKKALLANFHSGKGLRIKGGGDGLEELICELLELDGFKARIQSKKSNKGKGDIDIIADKELMFGVKVILCIQAKHHRGKTNMKSVNQVDIAIQNGEVDDQAIAMVISTAEFSSVVQDKAKKEGIILIDGENFINWLYDKLPELSSATLFGLGVSNSPSLFKG